MFPHYGLYTVIQRKHEERIRAAEAERSAGAHRTSKPTITIAVLTATLAALLVAVVRF